MAKKLKLQNDSWEFVSPGGFVAYETVTSKVLEAIAAIAGRGDGKAIYDHFLKHLQNQSEGTYRPLADYVYASRAAANVVAAAAKQNGALLVRSFVYACDLLRERGVAVPPREWTLMIWAENSSGYGIKNGTIVKFATPLDVMKGRITVERDVQEPVAPPPAPARRLKVFLCHAKEDKPKVWALHERLKTDGFDPWLDRIDLLPGADWDAEIRSALKGTDIVLVCLSALSIDKRGYVQREVGVARKIAEEIPQNTAFIIPVRLEECPVPADLDRWQAVDLFDEEYGYPMLVKALRKRAAKP